MKVKIECICGNNITSMIGCYKKANKYYCNKCQSDITKKKLSQLVKIIKEDMNA